MWNKIYLGERVQLDENDSKLKSIRISLFKDWHWQGEFILCPYLNNNLTFEKKYNKINNNEFKWFLVKKYNDFNIYLTQDEKYIMICNSNCEDLAYTRIYNIEEITE